MKKIIMLGVSALAALSFATVASATTCPSNEWCFGATGSAGYVTQGAMYSASAGSVYVYSEQIHNYGGSNGGSTDGVIVTGSSVLGGTSHPTIGSGTQALFAVNDSPNDEGIGIAPYDPAEGSSGSFENQLGIQDGVSGNSAYSNVLEIELGSNIAAGTSLQFLLQAGIGASTDQVDVWTADASAPQNVNKTTMTYDLTTPLGAISTNGTTSQFTITKNTSGIEFIAIVADCHYLLLDSITDASPSGVPEPRFYGLLLAGLLGFMGIAHKRHAGKAIA